MSNYTVEISADNTITVGLPSTGNGVAGPRGEKGYSAYEVAVKNGYTGTEAEWLATLKGEKGEKGEPGVNGSDGKPGKDGVDGANGTDGKPGVNGLSAYELAAKNGFTGNESSWLASLKGDKGDQGPKGNDGQNGVNGVDGKDGLSAYSIAVKNGYNGTEEEWVNKWLRGTIVSADVDDAGVMSMTDINGNVINTNLAPIAKAASSASAAEASAQAAANSASEAATHDTNAATSLAETRKSEQNAKTSEQNAAASAAQAAENARTLQADWNQTDETQTDYVKNKPTGFSVLYEVGLFELSKDNFYPIVFYPSNYILRCEIHSPSSDASNDYNQNVLSFRLLKTGWLDTPYSFFVETYNVYDANEITIGCIGYGQEQGNVVVWVRGGMKYRIISNRKPIIYPNGFSQNNEIFTVGPNYFGGYDYQKLSICFTPQETVKKGPWYDGIFSGTFDRAVCDVDGNTIKGTYLKKSLAEQSFTTNTLTATDAAFTGQTIVPTANEGNSSNAIASTEFVAKSIAALVNSAPETLNTLNELATALGNDPNFATTVTAELAKKLNSTEAESTYATKTEAGVPYQIKRNTAYKVGDVLTSPSLPPGCVIVVTQAGTTGSAEPDWATIKSNIGGVVTDGNVTFYINDTLSKHSIGDIIYKPTTKTGEHEYLLPLDGQTIDGTKYKRLVDYLGSATLPNLNGRYLRADSTPGQMVEAGLPNITGSIGGGSGSGGPAENGSGIGFLRDSMINGCFQPSAKAYGNESGLGGGTVPSGYPVLTANLDASRSSAIYGKSSTVTPPTYTVRAFICYA